MNLLPAPDFWIIEGKAHHKYVWERLISWEYTDLCGMSHRQLVEILKEALTALGGGWYSNQKCPNFMVEFNF